MIKPTCEELFDAACHNSDEYEEVDRQSDDSYRHGSYVYQVFHRKSDDTYWEASYAVSNDGEQNDLREGSARIYQVEPYEVVLTKYREIKE